MAHLNHSSINKMDLILDWSYGGIDWSIDGNGGPECRDHVTTFRRALETCLGVGLPLALYLAFRRRKGEGHTNNNNTPTKYHHYSLLRLGLLVSLAFVFGIEVGYKFASKQLIWLLNPCHVTSGLQIYLLAMPADYFAWHNDAYVVMLHLLHGPMAAIAFPVTEPLVMPFEVEIYWIQHFIILMVPAYFLLCNDGHGYQAHQVLDLQWLFASYLIWSAWHWLVMMWIGYVTLANVGSMLCAATSDPFSGPDYRLIGIVHQFVAIVTVGSFSAICSEWSRGRKLAVD